MAFPLAVPIIAAAVSSVASLLGQKKTNEANARLAREQMDFQREMSNTSYQRGVKDMTAAGLNPMLAYSQGGASTPGGQTAVMQNEASAAVSSAVQGLSVLQAMQGIETNQKLAENYSAQTEKVKSETMDRNLNTAKVSAEVLNTQNSAKVLNRTADKVLQETNRVTQSTESERRQLEADVSRDAFSARAGKDVADFESAVAEAKKKRMQLSKEKAYSDYYETSVGRAEPYIGLGTDVLSSASQVKRAFRR